MKIIKIITLLSLLCLSSLVFADKININTADAQTISETMTGVGLKRAQAIVDYRNNNGLFKTIDDLTLVKGIGSKTVEANREKLSIVSPEQATSPRN